MPKFLRLLSKLWPLKSRPLVKLSKEPVLFSNPFVFFEVLKTLTFLVFIAVLLRGSFLEPFKIPSSSMEPTLEIGDHIFVSKLSYGFRLPFVAKTLYNFSSPKRGDVIVFTKPDDPITTDKDESKINIIKRAVAIAGDKVRVKDTQLFINGEPIQETYARWQQGGIRDFEETIVPDDTVFMLGDNRDESLDSRFWLSPFLEVKRVKGRAFLIYWNSAFSFKRMFKPIR